MSKLTHAEKDAIIHDLEVTLRDVRAHVEVVHAQRREVKAQNEELLLQLQWMKRLVTNFSDANLFLADAIKGTT